MDNLTPAGTQKQCPTCPWRVGAKLADIPGYNPELHERLGETTIARQASLERTSMMACHYSESGDFHPCVGWIWNQANVGNNLGVRLGLLSGRLPLPEIDGPQRRDFQATLEEDDEGAIE